MREPVRNPYMPRLVSLNGKIKIYLQTLGGALTGPSTDEDGGSAGERHNP